MADNRNLEPIGRAVPSFDPGTGLGVLQRRWKVIGKYSTASNVPTHVKRAFETPDEEFTSYLLADQRMAQSESQDSETSTLIETYVEVPASSETLVQIGNDVVSYGENGLKLVEQRLFGKRTHVLTGTVGTTTGASGDIDELYLSGNGFAERGKVSAVVVKRWAQAGILDASKEFARDGLLYVTFVSQGSKFTPTALNSGKSLTDIETEAFQGGSAAPVRYSRVKDVNGFRKFTVTVMLKQDGSVLVDDGTDNEVHSYQKYKPYFRPGTLTLGTDSVSGSPGNQRFALFNIIELLSTDSNLAAGYKPFSVTNWASYNYSYVPSETKIAVVKIGGAKSYLGSGTFAANGGTAFGTEVESAAGSASSDPSPTEFNELTDQVVDSDNDPAFTTDVGVKWYRKIKVSMVGTMAANLGSV